jgi:hypothetical protein
MVDKECNLRAGVYKVQTFGTTQKPCISKKNKWLKLTYGTRGFIIWFPIENGGS